MIKTTSDIFPIAGGATGALGGAISEPSISFKAIIIYITLTIMGALIGYLVKTILDVFEIQKRIKNLKDQISNFKRNNKKN